MVLRRRRHEQAQALRRHYHCCCALPSLWTQQYYYILVHVHVLVGRVLPIVVEKTVELSGLWREFQCIFSTQSEIGLFPAEEESLYFGLFSCYIVGVQLYGTSTARTSV